MQKQVTKSGKAAVGVSPEGFAHEVPSFVYIGDVAGDIDCTAVHVWRLERDEVIPKFYRVGSVGKPKMPFRDWNAWMLENLGKPSRLDPDQRTAAERAAEAA